MRRMLALLVTPLSLAAWSKTIEWNEQVTFADGGVVTVSRSVSRSNLPASLPGGQSMNGQSLKFEYAGRRYAWEAESGFPMYVEPFALDVAGNDPILVFPAYGAHACDRFGFPQDGIAALRNRSGKWQPMPRAEIPAEVKVNLLQGGAWVLRDEHKGLTVDSALRRRIEGAMQVPGDGSGLTKVSAYYSGYQASACRILRRAPDPALDAAGSRLAAAQRSAPTLSATAGPQDDSRRELPSPMQQGLRWTGHVWLGPECNGIVEKTEMVANMAGEPRGPHTIGKVGTALLLADKTVNGGRAEILGERQLALQRVSCAGRDILVVGRRDNATLVVIRLKRNGEMRDVHNVVLPGADTLVDRGWAPLFDLQLREDTMQLAIGAFVEYSGDRPSTLLRSRTYSLKLPS